MRTTNLVAKGGIGVEVDRQYGDWRWSEGVRWLWICGVGKGI